MASIFTTLPAPAGNASGAAVDVSAFGATKTVTVVGSHSTFVTVEMANDAGHTKWAPLWTFRGAGERTFSVACRWLRATVSNYSGGPAQSVEVGGTDDGTLFATLVSPSGNGIGAPVNVSALGLFKTVQFGGPFRGAIIVEVSEDGGATYSQAFSFSQPGIQSTVIAADFMRVTRAATPTKNPGLPIINIAANDIGGGGGGGGGNGAPMFLPGTWVSQSIASSDDEDMTFLGGIGSAVVAQRPGSIIGISSHLSSAITGGSLTLTVTKNGTPVTMTITQSVGTHPQVGFGTEATGIDTYVAGDLIGVHLATSSDFAKSDALTIEVFVQAQEAP